MLEKHLLSRYPTSVDKSVTVRKFVAQVCREHIDLGLGDVDFESRLCSGDDSEYWQRLSEALLAHELREAGLELIPSRDGPDLLLKHQDRNTWIEVICPTPTGVPGNWLAGRLGEARSLPHEALLLRWTAAIKEKTEKLLGNEAKGIPGYLVKGRVGPEDSYVIAVNGRLLRGTPALSCLNGITQFPFAVEAVFPVGPFQVHIDRETLKATGSSYQHRPLIPKPNGSTVPALMFLDPAYRNVSAIWAADIDETSVIGNSKPLAVVHNPNAAEPIAVGLLPSDFEYVAAATENDEYLELTRRLGRPTGPS